MGTQEDIIDRINGRLTIDANLVEGGFSQDIIGSVSYELANIIETELNTIANKCFVATATGSDLDKCGADYGIDRRQDTKAIVYLTITGTQGAIVNQDVKATYNNLVFTVQELKEIGAGGTVSVKAECETAGSVGNVAANTITQFLTTYAGLTAVNNPLAAYDGFDTETDEIYRTRIQTYLKEDAANCNEAQYKQWALSISGVKRAEIEDASTAGAGNVGVYISSTSGTVSQNLIDSVTSYIEERQFINANVLVQALTKVDIDVTAAVQLKTGYTIIDIETAYTTVLTEYLESVTNLVSYFRCSELLLELEGVEDVTSFQINNDTDSIVLANTEYAAVGEVTISAS